MPKGPSATIALTGDTYTDSAAKSSKTVKYNVTWTGGAKEDYIIVQWVKGYFRDSGGKAKKAKMYDKITDVDFADWTIDSVDKDPAYWSDGSARWNYDVDGANAFSANDSPGPVKASDGKGAEAKLDFKTGVYKSAEVPTTTTGSITATPLTTLEPWEYHVLVDSSGKFTH